MVAFAKGLMQCFVTYDLLVVTFSSHKHSLPAAGDSLGSGSPDAPVALRLCLLGGSAGAGPLGSRQI
eukprot:4577674-Amphidinium_carterae.1